MSEFLMWLALTFKYMIAAGGLAFFALVIKGLVDSIRNQQRKG